MESVDFSVYNGGMYIGVMHLIPVLQTIKTDETSKWSFTGMRIL